MYYANNYVYYISPMQYRLNIRTYHCNYFYIRSNFTYTCLSKNIHNIKVLMHVNNATRWALAKFYGLG